MKRMLCIFWILLLALAPAQAQDTPPEAPADGAVISGEGLPETATGEAAVDSATADDSRYVVICPIDDEIDEAMAVVVKRAVAQAEKAEALLFIMNTPGGRVDSAIEITTAIMGVDCPTIAYVEGMGAISAGAIISYSCDYIYMAEGSNIGASTPIMPGVETTEAMDEKSNSFIRGKYKALGEANGHEPLLGEAMVDRNIEVRAYKDPNGVYHFERTDNTEDSSTEGRSKDFLDKILDAVSEDPEGGEGIGDLLRKVLKPDGGAPAQRESRTGAENDPLQDWIEKNTEIVSRKGELLTMSSREAVKFGLAESITADVDDTLREFLLGSVRRMEITPTWEESLFAFLTSPTIAGLLLMAGLGGIYIEARTPGFGAPGIIGTTCLALFFGSHMVLGMADWVDVVLIAIGFLLILAEIFLLPGFGVAGVLGIACLIAGSYLALVKAPIPEFSWQFQDMQDALYTLAVTMISLIVFIVVSGVLIPYTPVGRVLILSHAQDLAAGYVAQNLQDARQSIGLTGKATSPLRPAGKGRFGNKTFDVVTRGEFIEAGTPIAIIESNGNRYVVTEVKREERA